MKSFRLITRRYLYRHGQRGLRSAVIPPELTLYAGLHSVKPLADQGNRAGSHRVAYHSGPDSLTGRPFRTPTSSTGRFSIRSCLQSPVRWVGCGPFGDI